jgi:hypothetical protein
MKHVDKHNLLATLLFLLYILWKECIKKTTWSLIFITNIENGVLFPLLLVTHEGLSYCWNWLTAIFIIWSYTYKHKTWIVLVSPAEWWEGPFMNVFSVRNVASMMRVTRHNKTRFQDIQQLENHSTDTEQETAGTLWLDCHPWVIYKHLSNYKDHHVSNTMERWSRMVTW